MRDRRAAEHHPAPVRGPGGCVLRSEGAPKRKEGGEPLHPNLDVFSGSWADGRGESLSPWLSVGEADICAWNFGSSPGLQSRSLLCQSGLLLHTLS